MQEESEIFFAVSSLRPNIRFVSSTFMLLNRTVQMLKFEKNTLSLGFEIFELECSKDAVVT